MIFVVAANEPTVMVMLTEADVRTIRTGRTVFVDKAMTGGYRFDKVVLSLHPDNDAILAMIQKAGHKLPADLQEPGPSFTTPGQCAGCQGLMPEWSLHEGRCILCWYEEAQRLRRASN